jgi:hypothetical protein
MRGIIETKNGAGRSSALPGPVSIRVCPSAEHYGRGAFYCWGNMQYNIQGFDQKELVAKGLDAIDAVLLRWFIDFRQTDRMISKIHPDDGEYYWVRYQRVIEEFPILGITQTDGIGRRFKKLCDAGVLKSWIVKNQEGTYSYYRIASAYQDLYPDALLKSAPDSKVGCAPVSKVVSAPVPKVGPKDPSIKKNSSIKNTISADSIPYRLAKLLYSEHLKVDPKFLAGQDLDRTLNRWGADIDKLIRIDKRDEHEIARVIRWSQADTFWNSNILSGQKLREKYAQLLPRKNGGIKKESLTAEQAKSLNEIGFTQFPKEGQA